MRLIIKVVENRESRLADIDIDANIMYLYIHEKAAVTLLRDRRVEFLVPYTLTKGESAEKPIIPEETYDQYSIEEDVKGVYTYRVHNIGMEFKKVKAWLKEHQGDEVIGLRTPFKPTEEEIENKFYMTKSKENLSSMLEQIKDEVSVDVSLVELDLYQAKNYGRIPPLDTSDMYIAFIQFVYNKGDYYLLIRRKK